MKFERVLSGEPLTFNPRHSPSSVSTRLVDVAPVPTRGRRSRVFDLSLLLPLLLFSFSSSSSSSLLSFSSLPLYGSLSQNETTFWSYLMFVKAMFGQSKKTLFFLTLFSFLPLSFSNCILVPPFLSYFYSNFLKFHNGIQTS